MIQETPRTKLDQHILHVAEALRAECGDDFTIDQLSDRANVSRATIYRRIGTKDALLQQLANLRGQPLEQRDTRQRVLDAVPSVIGQHGLLGATMEQIAVQAGIGVATVYRHFGDKEGVLRAFIEEWAPQTALRDLIMHPTDDIEADLTVFAETVLVFLYQHRDVMRLVLAGTDAERAYLNQVRVGPTRLRDLIVTYFAAQIQAGHLNPVGEPQELALAFIGSLFAFAVIGPLHYGAQLTDHQQTAQRIAKIFLGQLTDRKAE